MVVYASHQIKPYKRNYTSYDLELIAMAFARKICRHYLYGVPRKIYTGHQSLKYIFTQKELNLRRRH